MDERDNVRAMVMRATSSPMGPSPLTLEERPTPRATEPFDVVVRVAAAGVCRTDLHLLTGSLPPPLPLVLGHENAGWVHEVGSAVTNVAVGDSVLCYPFVSTGLSTPERAGLDSAAPDRRTPGITVDGGFAEFVHTNARSMVPVSGDADLASLTVLTDAGLAAYRACKQAASTIRPGDTAVVLGIGGLGHLAVQIMRSISCAHVVAVDPNPAARDLGSASGAHDVVSFEEFIRRPPGTARAVLDFVGSDATSSTGVRAVDFAGTYFAVGVGGKVELSMTELVESEKTIRGVYVGTYTDLLEVTELATSGQLRPCVTRYPLEAANEALHDLEAGRVLGRAVLEPTSSPDRADTGSTTPSTVIL